MKKKLILPVLFLFAILLNSIILPVNGSNKFEIQNSKTELELEITYAHYLDADSDDVEDDVIVEFTTKIDSEQDWVYFILEIVLILPSGIYFEYFYIIISEDEKSYFTLFLYNTATESGWYDLYLTGKLYVGGYVEGTAYYTFDPPRDDGGQPL